MTEAAYVKDSLATTFVSKGWGWEKWIVNKPEYCGKILCVAKDRKGSLHYHLEKDEVFYLYRGKVLVYYADDLEKTLQMIKSPPNSMSVFSFLEKIILSPGDNFYVPPGRIHQICGLQDSEIFEISTQHKDADSIRLLAGD